MEHNKMKCNLKKYESTNRFRVYNTCKYYNISAITPISPIHHPFHKPDDLTVGAAVLAAASAQSIGMENGKLQK